MSDHNPNGRRRLLVAGASIAVMAAAGGFALGLARSGNRVSETTLLQLPEPRPLRAFEPLGGSGGLFSLDDLSGRWSLLFFGFTHCPDVCPSTLYELDRLHGRLAASDEAVAARIQVVFVSVDPERDTPERLAAYVRHFNPEFRAVTGDHNALEALTAELGIAYRIEDHAPAAETYEVVHSASVILVDPRGRLRGAFPPPLDPVAMAQEMATLVRRDG